MVETDSGVPSAEEELPDDGDVLDTSWGAEWRLGGGSLPPAAATAARFSSSSLDESFSVRTAPVPAAVLRCSPVMEGSAFASLMSLSFTPSSRFLFLGIETGASSSPTLSCLLSADDTFVSSVFSSSSTALLSLLVVADEEDIERDEDDRDDGAAGVVSEGRCW